MELKTMKAMIHLLMWEFCPEGTEFYWLNDSCNAIGTCKCKYCKKLNEFYDFEIGISKKYALNNSWEDVRRIAIQEIAHLRTMGNKNRNVYFDEFNRLMALFEEPQNDKAA
ncbi:MAG: hypothetical protein IKF09_03250 [Clostridiales bacterium]|nr:hypothetical protein [Clostridiales bacterium]